MWLEAWRKWKERIIQCPLRNQGFDFRGTCKLSFRFCVFHMFLASQAFSLRRVGLKVTSKAIQVTQLAESAPNTHCVVWLFQVITYDFMSEYENIWMCKYVDVQCTWTYIYIYIVCTLNGSHLANSLALGDSLHIVSWRKNCTLTWAGVFFPPWL